MPAVGATVGATVGAIVGAIVGAAVAVGAAVGAVTTDGIEDGGVVARGAEVGAPPVVGAAVEATVADGPRGAVGAAVTEAAEVVASGAAVGAPPVIGADVRATDVDEAEGAEAAAAVDLGGLDAPGRGAGTFGSSSLPVEGPFALLLPPRTTADPAEADVGSDRWVSMFTPKGSENLVPKAPPTAACGFAIAIRPNSVRVRIPLTSHSSAMTPREEFADERSASVVES